MVLWPTKNKLTHFPPLHSLSATGLLRPSTLGGERREMGDEKGKDAMGGAGPHENTTNRKLQSTGGKRKPDTKITAFPPSGLSRVPKKKQRCDQF